MSKFPNLVVQDQNIQVKQVSDASYLSLSDIARYKDAERSDYIIQNWMRIRSTVEFLGLWDRINNPVFNSIEFDGIKNEAGSNAFVLTPKRWHEKTQAIGIVSKAGRYGGTYAHPDIAFEFASWISAEFKLFLIKEFQRLKQEEIDTRKLEWNLTRSLSKINYRIHTDAIAEHIIPQIDLQSASFAYANEADLLNIALFGKTAKMWRDENPDKDGNVRDYASVEQLVVLANMESYNAEMIKQSLSPQERLARLNAMAISQLQVLVKAKSFERLEKK
jgi:hypothetical protein